MKQNNYEYDFVLLVADQQ